MFKIFHRLFDSWRVKDETPQIVHIGRNAIGVIEFYPSQVNPFIEGYGYVRVYDNGESEHTLYERRHYRDYDPLNYLVE